MLNEILKMFEKTVYRAYAEAPVTRETAKIALDKLPLLHASVLTISSDPKGTYFDFIADYDALEMVQGVLTRYAPKEKMKVWQVIKVGDV